MGFIDTLRGEGHAVESVCRVLREQGCEIAARTYRSWKRPGHQISARTVSDAVVIDALLATVGTPDGLYGRRKMVALMHRRGLPVAHCTIDRLMRDLGMNGVRRGKKARTTVSDPAASRAGDLLDRTFTATEPNRVWIADFTYVRTWAGFVYVAFVVDCYAQKIVAWHAATTKVTDLVLIPVRMATWQRDHDGHPVTPGELVHLNSPSTPRSGSPTTSTPRASQPRSDRRRRLRQRADGMHHRPVQDRVHQDRRLPHRAVQDHRGRRVRDDGLGRLVQQPAPALHPRNADPGRARDRPLRCTQPRAAAHMRPAENP